MKRLMKRILHGAVILFLGISVVLAGCAARVGVYDPGYRDYHRWDAREDGYYHNYWNESHRGEPYREYGKLNQKEQGDYWNWRHTHSDQDGH